MKEALRLALMVLHRSDDFLSAAEIRKAILKLPTHHNHKRLRVPSKIQIGYACRNSDLIRSVKVAHPKYPTKTIGVYWL